MQKEMFCTWAVNDMMNEKMYICAKATSKEEALGKIKKSTEYKEMSESEPFYDIGVPAWTVLDSHIRVGDIDINDEDDSIEDIIFYSSEPCHG